MIVSQSGAPFDLESHRARNQVHEVILIYQYLTTVLISGSRNDTTVSEVINKHFCCLAQLAANEVYEWSKCNLFKLNCDKSKEHFINFTRSRVRPLPAITLQRWTIKSASSVIRLKLSLTINNKVTWNNNLEEVIKKGSRRLYFLFGYDIGTRPNENGPTNCAGLLRTSGEEVELKR